MNLTKSKIMKHLNLKKVVLWTARIWGGLILAFVLIFLIGYIVDAISGKSDGHGFTSVQEVIAFICFPIGTIIGLALAYKWEGLGGLIASLGLIIMLVVLTFFMPIPEQVSITDFVKHFSIFIFYIFPPGLLYLIYWFLARKSLKTQ